MGQNFTRSLNQLLILSPRYVVVTCITHGEGVEGRGGWGVRRRGWEVGAARRLGDGRVGEH